MKNRFRIFLLVAVVFLVVNKENGLSADSPDDSHDSLHAIDSINEAEICYNNWDNFKEVVSWFLDYNNPYRNLKPSDDPDDIEECEYLTKKWAHKQDVFAQSLARADKAFFEFRRSVIDAVEAKYGEGRYADHASITAGCELTYWYIEFMQNKLFPYDWKELYENDKKLKNQALHKAQDPMGDELVRP